jgi:MYXO-CTERM domain-containing protein
MHVLSARATDPTGNATLSHVVHVTIQEGSGSGGAGGSSGSGGAGGGSMGTTEGGCTAAPGSPAGGMTLAFCALLLIRRRKKR